MILEEILSDIGDAGLFQYLFTIIITAMEVVIAWSMLLTAIVGAVPSWWCVDPSTYGTVNMTLDNTTFKKCAPDSPGISVDIKGYSDNGNYTVEAATTCVRYYDPSFVTIVSEWDLVCERKYIKAAINSIQMAGVLVGALLAGQASDTFGRRLTCYVTMVMHAVVCLVAGFSTSWEMYAFFSIPAWALGAGLMCLTAWRVPHWQYLHYICAAINVPFFFGWFVSPESLRWLAAKGQIEEADKVVERIAKMNGRSKSNSVPEQLALLADEEKSRGEETQRYSYHLLFVGGGGTSSRL
ncbi:hypothetical protein BaRGS_00024883 [Batillaria attramentaria]|uniref:Uncharacterized protein n=1 Tax=Batillaria attramentaria TaxID=370345 RepID=A0ABD0K9R5_9CAEN